MRHGWKSRLPTDPACYLRLPKACSAQAFACTMRESRHSASAWRTCSSFRPGAASRWATRHQPGWKWNCANAWTRRQWSGRVSSQVKIGREKFMSMHDSQLKEVVETGWNERDELKPGRFDPALREALDEVLARLERGELRVAEPTDSGWQVNAWVKQAILLHFRISWNKVVHGSIRNYFDKVELRFKDNSDAVEDCGARVVPPAAVRQGAYIGKDAVLMPSYVNIGAWVGRAGWFVPGPRWAPAPRLAQTCTYPAASASAGFSNRYRPIRPSSRMAVSSAPAPKWSRASSSRRVRSSAWAYFWVRAHASTIVKPAKPPPAGSLRDRSSWPAACRRPTGATA